MRDIAWRMGLTLMALLGLMVLAPKLTFNTAPSRLEEALGQTPQALVTDYLGFVARGNLETALALWPEPAEPEGTLEEVRASVTEELARYGAGMQYRVMGVTWWRSCCEVSAIDDPDTASVATIRVAITSGDQGAQTYLFETRAGDGPWGEPAGTSFREWAITGVHREGEVSEVQAWR